jgi:type III pantothenate kinase
VLLAIDVGNTNTVLGLFEGTGLVEHWRIATDARRTADELTLLVNGLLAMREQRTTLSGIACCSTVPAILHQVRDMGAKRFTDVPLVVVEPGVRTGVPILMDNPKEVGADRIVNSLAAYTLYGGPAVVVDFGTSTNFDVVSAKGEFIGGALAPGIEISVDALAARAAQLLKVELLRPRSVIGKTTVEALQSGILYGFAGQIDRIAAEIVAELGGTATVIATGGLASLVLEESRTIAVHEPWLTLIGLRLVFEKNT